MSESEFDKQVQQELQGLRLRPSEAVWENVEKELRRKKKRRVIVVLWLIAAIGLLGYSGYRLMRVNETPAGNTAVTTQQQKSVNNPANGLSRSTPPVLNPSGADGSVKRTGNEQLPVSQESTATISTKGSVDQQQPISAPQESNAHLSTARTAQIATPATVAVSRHASKTRKPRQSIADKPSAGTRSSRNKKSTQTNNRHKEDQDIDHTVATGSTQPANDPEPANPKIITGETTSGGDVAGNPAEHNKADSMATGKDSALTATLSAAPQQPIAKPKTKTASKIKWSLDLAAGASGPVASPFIIGGSAEKSVMDNLNSSPNQGGIWSPVTPSGTFGQVYVPRSDIKPGPAARVGILAEFPVSKRVSLSTGLQYQYQSNNIRIGYYKDTSIVFSNYAAQTVSVRAVYQGAQQKTFTNRFHSIQVPLNFHWQMNEGKKLPLLLNAGISAGYLISTNGLLYDSLQGGIYYHDKKAFNRFQLNISTGISFRLGNSKGLQWSIGPEVSMGMRRMVKAEYDKKQYPVFIGLQGRIYLPGRRR